MTREHGHDSLDNYYEHRSKLFEALSASRPSVVVFDYDYVVAVGIRQLLSRPDEETINALLSIREGPNPHDVFVVSNRPSHKTNFPRAFRLPEILIDKLGEERVFGSDSMKPGFRRKDEKGIALVADAIASCTFVDGGLVVVDDRLYRGIPFMYGLQAAVSEIRGVQTSATLIQVPSFPFSDTRLGRLFP